ncbi:MAG TPA: transcription termination factor Rho [Opitutaceae bacterium]|nr:transcription termination factor Rho [Opitutaceae bacterium]
METPRSSKDSDNNPAAPESESPAPKRRTTRLTRGKSASPRTRKKAEAETVVEPVSTGSLPSPDAEPMPEPPKAPEPKVARAPEPEPEPYVPPQQEVLSFSPDDEPAPEHAPEPQASPTENAPGGERSPVAEAPISGEGAPSATGQEPPPGGMPPGGKRFGREYWKQLKLEKKKAKLLRQQQGQGGPPSGGQPHGGGHGPHGGHGGGQHPRAERPDRGERGERGGRNFRERAPQQPPPPNFVQVSGELPPAERFADLSVLEATAVDIASAGGEPIAISDLAPKSLGELTSFARELGVSFDGVPNRHQVLKGILQHAAAQKRPVVDRGWLDLTDRGYGFIVHAHDNYRLYPDDTYVPESLVKKYGLKRGVQLEVQVQAPIENERCPSTVKIVSAMGREPELLATVKPFEELEPYYPLKRILLEVPGAETKDVSMRLVDIVTPIGFGQRGLIVAPPRTGKTVLMQNIANAISDNFPEVKLIILLVDERPEEVTDFRRHTKGEVVSSTFDETPESHVHCAEMVVERARRMVEQGEHIVILLDSITRLARAYNNIIGSSGKIMSGGLDTNALQKPKRFFGSARNIEGGGSLTIVGTALIDTGSKMDEVIFEEFKGTGNMELHLDRDLVNKRIFPAVNMDRSGTRKEELLYHPDELQRIFSMRRSMQGLPPTEAMEMVISRLKKTKSNVEFLMGLNR